MDNKVKITLTTTGVLLVIIILSGLYSTLNPELSEIKIKQIDIKNEQVLLNDSKLGIDSRSKSDIRTNAYLFPDRDKIRVKVNPNIDLDAKDQKGDDPLALNEIELGEEVVEGVEDHENYIPPFDEQDFMSTEDGMDQDMQDHEGGF